MFAKLNPQENYPHTITKLATFVFSNNNVIILQVQKVYLNDLHSSWSASLFDVLQRFFLGSFLLFNLFLYDIFYFTPDFEIMSCINDNARYSSGVDVGKVIKNLENRLSSSLK